MDHDAQDDPGEQGEYGDHRPPSDGEPCGWAALPEDPGVAGSVLPGVAVRLAEPDGTGGVDGSASRSFSSVAASRVTSFTPAALNDMLYLALNSLKNLPAYPSRKLAARSSGPIAITSYGVPTGRKSTRMASPACRIVEVAVSRCPLIVIASAPSDHNALVAS